MRPRLSLTTLITKAAFDLELLFCLDCFTVLLTGYWRNIKRNIKQISFVHGINIVSIKVESRLSEASISTTLAVPTEGGKIGDENDG